MISEEELTSSRDSLINTSVHPPSTPKPTDKSTNPRRASKIVRSPYLAPVVPNYLIKGTTPCRLSNSDKINTQKHQSNGARKRTSSVKSYVRNLEEDFSGKNVFDLREDLTNAKRTVAMVTKERDSLKNELYKLKQLMDKRDKEIEDLIVGGHVSNRDRVRVISGSKTDTLLTLSSLRHRLNALERSVREKETIIASLKADIKTTKLREMETEKEVYYGEILRLQRTMEILQQELDKDVPHSKKQLLLKVHELERQLKDVTANYKAVRLDKEKLLKELGHWNENGTTYPENDEVASKYMTLTQGAAVTALVNMELTLQEKEEKILELENKYESLIKKTAANNSEKDNVIANLQSNFAVLEEKLSKLLEENSKNKLEMSNVTESLKNETTNSEDAQKLVKTLQEELVKEQIAREHAQKLKQRKIQKLLVDKKHKSKCATIIQSHWRYYQSIKKQNLFEQEQNEIIRHVQSIFRGHHTRKQMLSNFHHTIDNNSDTERAELLHSILQGHLTRKRFLIANNDKIT